MFGRAVTKSPEVTITVLGQQVRFIIDTGSEVTILPETIFRELTSSPPKVQDVSKWLRVYAANGMEVPYVGYTELDMDVFGVQLGCVGVLISKESRASKQPTGLLGCNVISEVQAALKERHGSDYLNTIQSEVNQCWTEALLADFSTNRYHSTQNNVSSRVT